MNERLEAIKQSIQDSLEKAKTALNNKDVKVDTLKVSEIPGYIRQIELNKIKLTVNCSEFDSGTITATKDGKVRTGVVEAGKAVIMLPSEGNWHIEHELGDYVETQVSGLEATCELVKKKVTFSEGECSEEKLVIHIDSVVGNNSNDNFIRVKKNGVTIEVQAQLVGSDIEITNFEYEEGATYTVEYVLSEEVRGSIDVTIAIPIGESTELEKAFLCPEEIDRNSITKIIFTDEVAPKGIKTYDKSKAKDYGVVVWEKDNTLYCSTQKEGKEVQLFNTIVKNGFFPNTPFYQSIDLNTNYKFENVTQIELNKVNTSQLNDMSDYFYRMSSLIDIKNIENINTQLLKKADRMFYQTDLQEIDLSNWNIEILESCQSMFNNCPSLKTVNLNGWNVSQLKKFNTMFENDSNLISVDLSSWEPPAKIYYSYRMFSNCTSLTTIYAKEWEDGDPNNNKNTFENCTSLPNFSSSEISDSKAKWKENGGYFTNPAEKAS